MWHSTRCWFPHHGDADVRVNSGTILLPATLTVDVGRFHIAGRIVQQVAIGQTDDTRCGCIASIEKSLTTSRGKGRIAVIDGPLRSARRAGVEDFEAPFDMTAIPHVETIFMVDDERIDGQSPANVRAPVIWHSTNRLQATSRVLLCELTRPPSLVERSLCS